MPTHAGVQKKYLAKNKQQWFPKQKAKTVQVQLSEFWWFF